VIFAFVFVPAKKYENKNNLAVFSIVFFDRSHPCAAGSASGAQKPARACETGARHASQNKLIDPAAALIIATYKQLCHT
jgi:predicted ATPase